MFFPHCLKGGGQRRSAIPRRSQRTSSGWDTMSGSFLFTSLAPTITCGPTRPGSSLTWTWTPTAKKRWGKVLMPPTRKVTRSSSEICLSLECNVSAKTSTSPGVRRPLQLWRRRLWGFGSCRQRRSFGSCKKTGRTTGSPLRTNISRSGRRISMIQGLCFVLNAAACRFLQKRSCGVCSCRKLWC